MRNRVGIGVFWAFCALIMTSGMGFADTDRVLIFPRLAKAQTVYQKYQNLADFYTAFALTNVGATDAVITLTAYAENGTPLSGPDIVNPGVFEIEGQKKNVLPAGYQIGRYAFQIFGKGILGQKAWAEVICTGGDVRGFYEHFNSPFDFISGDEVIDKVTASTRIMLPYAVWSFVTGQNTEVEIVNPGEVSANVKLTYWTNRVEDPNSSTVVPIKFQIAPHGKIQVDSRDIIAGLIDNYFEITSDQPVVAAEVVFRNILDSTNFLNIKGTLTITAVNGINASRAVTKKDVVGVDPHLTLFPALPSGQGWFTNIIMWDIGYRRNISAAGVLPILSLWDGGGRFVLESYLDTDEPDLGEKIVVDLKKFIPGESFDGSLSYRTAFDSKYPDQGLLVLEEYGDTAVGVNGEDYQVGNFKAVVPSLEPVTSAVLSHVAEGEFAPGQFFGTGIVLTSIQRDANTPKNVVTLSLFSETGQLLKTREFQLGGGEKFALTLPQIFEGMTLRQFSGHIRINSSLPFKTFGLYWVNKYGRIVAVSTISPQ